MFWYFIRLLQLKTNQVIRSVTEEIGKTEKEEYISEDKLELKKVPECGKLDFYQKKQLVPEENLVTIQAIREYLELIWKNYKNASRVHKKCLIDEVCRNLEIHRKSAIRLLNKNYPPRSFQGFRGGRKRTYSDKAKEHLVRLWKTMGYIGPQRLKAALPEWIVFYEHHDCDLTTKNELLGMSEKSIQRFLEKERTQLQRRLNTGTYKGVRKFISKVPIRNLEETPTSPGHCEADCVAHCGGSISGSFAWTLNLTDIATGWTECEAIWAKNSTEVRKALTLMEKRLPFALKALYFDNGNEFMNDEIINKFATKDRQKPLPIFRGRPYRKNDQCYIEQKNYTHVRHLFGYGRIDWQKAVPMMNNIYRKEWRDLQNYFLPQQKLIEKWRINAKIKRKMDSPITPFERLKQYLPVEEMSKLEKEKTNINPFRCRTNQRCKLKAIFGYFKNSIHKGEWGKMAI